MHHGHGQGHGQGHGAIVMRHEETPNGVKVIETSADPYAAVLIQAHAEVVSLFIKNGRAEMRKNHAVPARPTP